MTALVRIGTRGSRLATTQAEWVRRQLETAHPSLVARLVIVRTSGDRIQNRPLSEVGGKGLFVKELESALTAGEIDCAVHSLKDVPGDLAAGMILAAVPEREDARDVVLTRRPGGWAALPESSRVGTCSPRRAALVRALWPSLRVVDMRGNVDTRVGKLQAGQIDALVLASAGIRRLGIVHPHSEPCDPREFIPAVGQGALAIETRADGFATLLSAVEDPVSRVAADAERAFLITVGGSCVTPLGGHASVEAGRVTLRALIAHPDGSRIVRGCATGEAREASQVGAQLAEQLLSEGGAEILRQIGQDG